MSTGPNTPDQLDLVQQMNSLLQDQNKILQQIAGTMSAQAKASQQVSQGNSEVSESAELGTQNINKLTQAMKENQGGSEGLAGAMGKQATATQGANKSLGDLGNQAGVTVGLLGALSAGASGLSSAFSAVGGVMNLFFGGITAGMGILKGAVGIVGGFFSGLMGAAADYHNAAAGEMHQANESIRKEFGDITSDQGKFIKEMAGDLGTAKNALGAAGNSLWASVGRSAAVLTEMAAIAGEFGDSLVRMQDQIKGATGEMFLMRKGMNISTEAFKNIAASAEASGGSMKDALTDTMVASAHLSKTFGVDVKVIGKNIDKMAKDMNTFGHMGPKSLAAVATYATKLGVSIEALKGTMDAFDTFESAAANAGKLAEAFGMNVDVMGMMNSENPAERMDMLRKSFEETGKSVSDLSRHELKLLSESMGGLPVDEMKNALSMSTDEMGFGDFESAAEEAAEKMTPEQAMQDVAKSIDKLAAKLSKLSSGPLSNFLNGFMEAVERSSEFQDIMKEVSAFLKEFFKLGKEVGKMFVETFLTKGSAVRDMISGIFNLEKIQAFTATVKLAFTEFFSLIKTDPKKAVENLFDKVLGAFKTWFGGGDQAKSLGGMLAGLLENGLKIVAGLAPKIIKTASGYIRDFAKSLGEFLNGDNATANGIGDGIGGAFMMAFNAISDSLVNDLGPALLDLFGVLFDKFGPTLIAILGGVFTIILVKSIVSAAMAALAGAAVKVAIDLLAGKLVEMLGKSGDVAPDQLKEAPSFADIVAQGADAFGSMLEALGKIEVGHVLKAAGVLLALAGTLAVSLVILGAAMFVIAKMFRNVPFMDVMKALLVTTAATIQSVLLIAAVRLLGTPSVKLAGNLVALAVILAVGGVALGGAALAIGWAWQNVNKELVAGAMLTMTFLAILAIPFTLAAAAMSLVMTIPAAVAVGLGMIALTGVLIAAAGLAIPAGIFGEAWSTVDQISVLKGAAILGGSVVGLAVFLGSMIGFAAYLLLMPIVLAGVATYLAFMTGIATAAPFIVEQLNYFGEEMSKINLGQVMFGVAALAGTLVFVTGLVLGGVYLAALVIPMIVAAIGIGAAAVFFKASTSMFISMIQDLAIVGQKIKNPEKMMQTVIILGKLVTIVGQLADMGIKAAKMAIVSSLFGGSSATDMMNSMGGFVTGIIGSLTGLIKELVVMAGTLGDPAALKGAEALANIIGAIAGLASALIDPMTNMKSEAGFFSDGPSQVEMMEQLGSTISGILLALSTHLPSIVKSLIGALEGMGEPEAIKKKADALKSIFDGLLSLVTSVTEISKMSQKGNGDGGMWDDETTSFDPSVMNGIFKNVTTILGGNELKGLISAAEAVGALITDPESAKKNADALKSVLGGTVSMIKSLGELGAWMLKPEGFMGLKSLQIGMGKMTEEKLWPSDLMGSIITESTELAAMMGAMEADLGTIDLRPTVSAILGFEGDRTFTIKPEAVQLTVRLAIKVDAQELALAIKEGNSETDGFFTTTAKADKAQLEGAGAS